MILIIGRFEIHADQWTEFLEFAREVAAEQEGMAGCISFAILQDITAANRFVMLEQWADREALEAHFETELYVRADARLHEFVVDEPEWEEYEV